MKIRIHVTEERWYDVEADSVHEACELMQGFAPERSIRVSEHMGPPKRVVRAANVIRKDRRRRLAGLHGSIIDRQSNSLQGAVTFMNIALDNIEYAGEIELRAAAHAFLAQLQERSDARWLHSAATTHRAVAG